MVQLFWKNATSKIVGEVHGITHEDLAGIDPLIRQCHAKVRSQISAGLLGYAALPGSTEYRSQVQALVSRANFGTPERKVSGLDRNRVAMLLAVLEKRTELVLAGHDVFVNAVGGVRLVEPAADLPAAIAIASSFTDRAISPELMARGEVGLAGEVRGVSQIEARLREAAKLGWTRAIVPRDNARSLRQRVKGLKVEFVATLAEALEAAAS